MIDDGPVQIGETWLSPLDATNVNFLLLGDLVLLLRAGCLFARASNGTRTENEHVETPPLDAATLAEIVSICRAHNIEGFGSLHFFFSQTIEAPKTWTEAPASAPLPLDAREGPLHDPEPLDLPARAIDLDALFEAPVRLSWPSETPLAPPEPPIDPPLEDRLCMRFFGLDETREVLLTALSSEARAAFMAYLRAGREALYFKLGGVP